MLTKKSVALALLMLPAFFTNAQFSLTGSVKNKKTNEPIPGAVISIDKTFIAAQSNSEGNFEIKNLKNGTYVVKTTLLGFQKKMDTILISENKTISIYLEENTLLMDEVIVTSTRADEKSAMAYNNINKEQLAQQNLGQDLPILLNQLTSVVTTSDAGNGVGYTGIRIRGTDATRINVTINGIPVNDAESQGVFWVNTPDLASSIDNIQVQRGVGTSTNGAGAFGGSLNIQTSKLNTKPNAAYHSSYGSFNTFKNTIMAGTGLINNKFVFDTRLSKITSDGFIDRANSDLKSYYLSGAYYGKKTIIKFITFSGLEKTYQAWYGIPESRLNGDVDGMNNYILNNGLDTEEAENLLNSDSRTYNPYTYKNQIDHYQQNYYQLHFSNDINSFLNANLAFHYTKGFGYYEEYKKQDAFVNYGLDDIIIGNDTITETNLIRRRWLDNDFYGTTFSLNYNNRKKITATIGGGWNKYIGQHFGEIIWAEHSSNSTINQKYYNDTANKADFNVFAKINYQLAEKINLFGDIQYRSIYYSFLGFDNNLSNVEQSANMNFINPKVGINYDVLPNANIYASYSIGNKEPNRNDFTLSTPQSRPKHETLNDIELGYKHQTNKAMWGINLYHMNYKNQLVLTGEINDVGAYNRANVAKSYRQGIEVEWALKPVKFFTWEANFTLSKNKIKNFVEYIDNYDTYIQDSILYDETDIAFSPNTIASSALIFEPIKNLKIAYITKYVGKQYLDNTSNENRKLNAYIIDDIRINYSFKTRFIPEIGFTFYVNNLFNKKYESNGYTWGYVYGGQRIVENFYYPQAGTNFMAGISLKF